jgi:ribosome biogenesis GTPase
MSQELEALGWDERFAADLRALSDARLRPARVAAVHRGKWALLEPAGPLLADLAGRARHEATNREALPAVGDWVAVDDTAVIHAVLPRRGALRRADPDGVAQAQVLAANVDVAFVAMSLNQDLNHRRLERFLAVVADGGAEPVVLLTKSDLDSDSIARVREVTRLTGEGEVYAISVPDDSGIEAVRGRVAPGRTAVLLGSSGVGKSTLVNALLGSERQAVAPIRLRDGRGRHTTTHRELFVLPGGGLMIDTPGLRLPRMWAGSGVEETFADIEALAAGCRFSDCTHTAEPGCAVRAAIEAGELDADRLAARETLEGERQDIETRAERSGRGRPPPA